MVPKKTGYIKAFDDTPIYYEVKGEGPPLFFAYGLACSSNHWHHQVKYFSQNYTCITWDYRGHNRSEAPKNRDHLTMDALAMDLKSLCDHLNVKSAGFLGHSFGVQVLLKTYDTHPQLFHNLIFINGFASNPIQGMFGVDTVSSAFRLFKQGYEQMPETLSYIWKAAATNPISMRLTGLAGGFNLNLTSFKDIEIYARGVASIELDVFIQLFDQMMFYDARGVLPKVTCPTLIIGGDSDSVTSLPYQRLLHKEIKGSEFLVVPYGSHCTQLDMPDFVNLKVEKFLQDIHFDGEKSTPQAESGA